MYSYDPDDRNTPRKIWIYVLKLRDDCVYVGQTNDLRRRFEEHVGGRGARR